MLLLFGGRSAKFKLFYGTLKFFLNTGPYGAANFKTVFVQFSPIWTKTGYYFLANQYILGYFSCPIVGLVWGH